jgi:hypothetical protein
MNGKGSLLVPYLACGVFSVLGIVMMLHSHPSNMTMAVWDTLFITLAFVFACISFAVGFQRSVESKIEQQSDSDSRTETEQGS